MMGIGFQSCTDSEDFVAHHQHHHQRGGAAGRSGAGSEERVKREDCRFVKHDNLFSNWKVLVGPLDWREHAAHKEGVERCRTQNLPAAHCNGPGVYELGVTAPSWLPTPAAAIRRGASTTTTTTTNTTTNANTNASTPALRRRDVVVVYVGHADNIRKRLQEFGQPGAHLERSRSSRFYTSGNEESLCGSPYRSGRAPNHGKRRGRDSWCADQGGSRRSVKGPRLFSEVFALGSSIAFRWAETDSKVVAERVEAELLSVFDYAWNKGSNGCRRSRDILAKLFMGWPYPNRSRLCSNYIPPGRRWLCLGTKRVVGISIAVQKPRDVHPHIESPRCSWMRRFCLLLSKVRGPHVDLGSQAGTPHQHSSSSPTATARASDDRREMILASPGTEKGIDQASRGLLTRSSWPSPLGRPTSSSPLSSSTNDPASKHPPPHPVSLEAENCLIKGFLCLPTNFIPAFKRRMKVVKPASSRASEKGGGEAGKRPRSLSFNSWMVKLESERVHADSSDLRWSDECSENERILDVIVQLQLGLKVAPPAPACLSR